MLRQLKLKEHKGQAVVNHAHLLTESPDCALVEIDLATKYCTNFGHTIDAGIPGVVIGLTDRSHDPDAGNSRNVEGPTVVEFPEYRGWRVFSSSGGVYTFSVTLYKPQEEVK